MIVMIMPVSLIVVRMIGKTMRVVRVVVRGGGRYRRQGTRSRGGDNPGELGDQEQSDQQDIIGAEFLIARRFFRIYRRADAAAVRPTQKAQRMTRP